MTDKTTKSWFTTFAQKTSTAAGSAPAFATAILVVVVWALTGPIFHYSDVWQLVINTGTTIVTFLMVFLVQNAQNRDGKIIQLKLDELLCAIENAETAYVDMDEMSEAELEALRARYSDLAEAARTHENAGNPKKKARKTSSAAQSASKQTAVMKRKRSTV